MERILVWDLPTRLFHWLFSAGLAAAALIAFFSDEHGGLFPYHALIGMTIVAMAALRIAWGFAGSRYARFRSFLYGPREVTEYFMGVLSRKGKTYVGHNPGSAYAIIGMLVLMFGIAGSGILLGSGNKGAKEIHETLVYLMLLLAGFHVLGVVLHTILRRENITASMVHGWKSGSAAEGVSSNHAVVAGFFLLATAAWGAGLLANYSSRSQSTSLPVLGTEIRLGEGESHGDATHATKDHQEHDDD